METRGGRGRRRVKLRESSAYKSADFSIVENSSQSTMGSSKAERLRDISITISCYLFFWNWGFAVGKGEGWWWNQPIRRIVGEDEPPAFVHFLLFDPSYRYVNTCWRNNVKKWKGVGKRAWKYRVFNEPVFVNFCSSFDQTEVNIRELKISRRKKFILRL